MVLMYLSLFKGFHGVQWGLEGGGSKRGFRLGLKSVGGAAGFLEVFQMFEIFYWV